MSYHEGQSSAWKKLYSDTNLHSTVLICRRDADEEVAQLGSARGTPNPGLTLSCNSIFTDATLCQHTLVAIFDNF